MDELHEAVFGSFLKGQARINGWHDEEVATAIETDFTFLAILGCGNDYVPGITESVFFFYTLIFLLVTFFLANLSKIF
jgi:hypothetical protein